MAFLSPPSHQDTKMNSWECRKRTLVPWCLGGSYPSLGLGRGGEEAGVFGQAAHQVQALDALAGAAFDQVVDRGEDDRRLSLRRDAQVDEVRPLDVVDVGRALAQPDELLAGVRLLEDLEDLVR